jgi:hypothetical protein
MICSYGCGKTAKYFFKNGKCCCSEKWQFCPAMKKQISKKLQGRISPNKGVKFSKERRKAISEGLKGLTPWNKGKRVLDLKRIKERYPFFYQIEKPIEKDGEIYVQCKFCKEYFIPSKNQLSERIRCLENNRDNSEQHFYCSDECKQKCPVYCSKPVFINKKNYPSEAQLKVYRKKVLERDNYTCSYCGERADRVHHRFPIKTCPEFSLDIDYGLSVCHDCHNKYAHRDECSYHKIAYRKVM